MPSDFSKEYKKYIEENTPNLWARIEAGIEDEAETVVETSVESGSTAEVKVEESLTAAEANPIAEAGAGQTEAGKKVIQWAIIAKRFGQVAAVAAIALVSFGLVTMLARGGKSMAPAASESAAPAAAADSAATDSAAYDSYDSADMAAEADHEPVAEAALEEAEDADMAADTDGLMSDSAAAAEATESPATNDATLSYEANGVDADSIDLRKILESFKADKSEEKDKNAKGETAANSSSASAAAPAEEATAGSSDTSEEPLPESGIYEEAILIDMSELSPTERTNASTGEQYKYGMTFVKDDVTINCMITEHDLKYYAENGVHFKKDSEYNIYVVLRDDYDPASSTYPYVLKLITDTMKTE